MGERRERQTAHSSVKLYCKIRRSTVPDTLQGTQSSFADVLKFKFFYPPKIYLHASPLASRTVSGSVRAAAVAYIIRYMSVYTFIITLHEYLLR